MTGLQTTFVEKTHVKSDTGNDMKLHKKQELFIIIMGGGENRQDASVGVACAAVIAVILMGGADEAQGDGIGKVGTEKKEGYHKKGWRNASARL